LRSLVDTSTEILLAKDADVRVYMSITCKPFTFPLWLMSNARTFTLRGNDPQTFTKVKKTISLNLKFKVYLIEICLKCYVPHWSSFIVQKHLGSGWIQHLVTLFWLITITDTLGKCVLELGTCKRTADEPAAYDDDKRTCWGTFPMLVVLVVILHSKSFWVLFIVYELFHWFLKKPDLRLSYSNEGLSTLL